MDSATAAVLIIVLLALIVIAAFFTFRQRDEVKIQGRFGTGPDSNVPKDAKSLGELPSDPSLSSPAPETVFGTPTRSRGIVFSVSVRSLRSISPCATCPAPFRLW